MTDVTPPNAADIEEALRDVGDPELGVNIVDLGLLYGITHEGNSAIADMSADVSCMPIDRRHRRAGAPSGRDAP